MIAKRQVPLLKPKSASVASLTGDWSKKPKKLPLVPPQKKAHTFERPQQKSHASDNERRASHRAISSPKIVNEHPLHQQENLVYENIPQADEIEEENYTVPEFQSETILVRKNIAYKENITTGQQDTRLITPPRFSEDVYTDEGLASGANSTPLHSYDEPHSFWV